MSYKLKDLLPLFPKYNDNSGYDITLNHYTGKSYQRKIIIPPTNKEGKVYFPDALLESEIMEINNGEDTINVYVKGYDEIAEYRRSQTMNDIYGYTVKNIVRSQGGFREKDILSKPHTIEKDETWNDEHKVLNVLLLEAEEDGYRNGFAVDIVKMNICG